MKLIILTTAFLAVASSQSEYDISITEEERAYHQNKATKFKEHLIPFNTRVALEVNNYTKGHFIISAHNIWYGLDFLTESELVSTLNLPEQQSLRQQFLGLALSMTGLGEGMDFMRSRAIAVDETVDIKEDWETYNDVPGGMPDYLQSLNFEKPFGHVQKYLAYPQPNIPYSSHTILLDHVMIDGLWNSTFASRTVQQGPFYNNEGKPIGKVDYLRMRDRVRVVQSPDKNVKVLEVPVGSGGKHSMLFAVGDKVESMIETVFSGDIFSDLEQTEDPIEVAIPRLSMSSGMDLSPVFENIRRSGVFSDQLDNSKILDTPASPMGYYHIVTVNITDSEDRNDASVKDVSNEEADFAAIEKNGFIANRPFLFALFTPLYLTDVRVPVFTGVYTFPGKRGQQRI